jgi:hypothetical protein
MKHPPIPPNAEWYFWQHNPKTEKSQHERLIMASIAEVHQRGEEQSARWQERAFR